MTKYEIKLYAKDKKTISRFLKFFNQSQNQIIITLNTHDFNWFE